MSCLVSSVVTLTWDTGILFEKLKNMVDEFEKHPFHYASSLGQGFKAKHVFFFDIFIGNPHVDALVIRLY